jgi:hypothetical protein
LSLAIALVSVIGTSYCKAQNNLRHDSSYYEIYPDKLTIRTFLSQKYAHFDVPSFDGVGMHDLEYRSNAKTSMGIGATYHNLSLNVGYGFGFLNNNSQKDKTKGVDVQLHLYLHNKWAIDVLGMTYKGYYLNEESNVATSNHYYYRPDIKLNVLGAAAYRIANSQKFSYTAGMTQNQWQKKSAGSLLYGGEICYASVKGDSSFVPEEVSKGFPQNGINNVNFLRAGLGLGYAYTLVIKKHFFATASLIGNLDINVATEKGIDGKASKTSLSPGTIYKAAIGYNGNSWALSATWAGMASWFTTASSPERYFMPTGNYRLTLSKRINLKKH